MTARKRWMISAIAVIALVFLALGSSSVSMAQTNVSPAVGVLRHGNPGGVLWHKHFGMVQK